MEPTSVSKIKQTISENASISEPMKRVCFAIIDHVKIGVSTRKHLTFHTLYNISPEAPEEDFYDAVFYLRRPNIEVLTQKFEALHPQEGYIAVPDKEEILQSIRNEDFFNPFTGETLSEEQFGEEVITYFSVSDKFERMINDERAY